MAEHNRYGPVQAWAMEHPPEEKMKWKQSFWDQIIFLREEVPAVFASSYEEVVGIRQMMEVVSSHTSKSIKLPVVKIEWRNADFIVRNNFYDWKVSATYFYKEGLDTDFGNLFKPDEKISSVYCEGFEDRWVYGPFSKDKRKFTVSIASNYMLWTFFWAVKQYILKTRP